MADAWKRAAENFKNIPQGMMDNWVFAVGFGVLDFTHSLLRSSIVMGMKEGSTGEVLVSNGLLGLLDSSKFLFWDSQTSPE